MAATTAHSIFCEEEDKMATIRRAEAVWEGDLRGGKGHVTAKSSGAFQRLPVTGASRTVAPEGKSSPEELIAAAHASCFAMTLSFELTKAGTPPQRLDVVAAVTFDKTEAGFRVVSSNLEVRGAAKGLDASHFAELVLAAKDSCPVMLALKGNVSIEVSATLVS